MFIGLAVCSFIVGLLLRRRETNQDISTKTWRIQLGFDIELPEGITEEYLGKRLTETFLGEGRRVNYIVIKEVKKNVA